MPPTKPTVVIKKPAEIKKAPLNTPAGVPTVEMMQAFTKLF